ncbi:MAG: DUF4238 domain-containing protein [Candidatus Pacebacteria bacterium]|nr:DUF4238 domain-containing protein [Candidatus Paceibacterota bacterium]
MEHHHTVQKKYLAQWVSNELSQNNFWVYSIPENKIIEREPDWKGFKQKDFNVLDEEEDNFYLPEKVTALIDSLGIQAIRRINPSVQNQLQGYDRCYLSFYIALQYIRTPRHREELDKFIEATTLKFMRADLNTPEKIKVSKKDLLEARPRNEAEKRSLERALAMSDDELKKEIFEFIHGKDIRIKLTNSGHSKSMLKVNRLAKNIFDIQWVFLAPVNRTAFITSDNPCYTVPTQKTKTGVGILSENAMSFFPLRPDLCICLVPKYKSQREYFNKLDRKGVREINQGTLENSYQSVIAKEKAHLEHLTRKYDHKNHRSTRDTIVRELGDYILFSNV